MDAYTTPELVHLAILKDAEDIANRRFAEEFDIGADSPWRPGRFSAPPGERDRAFASGRIYRADSARSEKGGLCLSVDEVTINAADQDKIDRIHQIGMEAIHESILLNRNSFVGLIIGEAREGRNYFDRFPSEGQTRLF